MTRTIRRLFWAWEFEREEQWLNAMSAQGWQLHRVGFCTYVFEEGLRGEYSYRLELLDCMPGHEQSVRYLRFMEDAGIEQIGSYFRWVYFRKKADGAPLNLFSDLDSRIRHLDRILLLTGAIAGVNLLNASRQLLSWITLKTPAALMASALCLFLGGLIGYGFLRIRTAKQRLAKEKILRE